MATASSPQKLALISVFNKQGLDTLARELVEAHDYRILSTGGTFQYLREKGIPCEETSGITGFEELLGGRVKTLHPTLFAGILAQAADITSDTALPLAIDTVVVNLYPFEEERRQEKHPNTSSPNNPGQDPDHLLHFIDIGGSALIRAAAKNHPRVNVLTKPNQYDTFLQALREGQGNTTFPFRKKLALEAFQRSASYEAAIAGWMGETLASSPESDVFSAEALSDLPASMTLPLQNVYPLRYGENPHQLGALYSLGGQPLAFELLHGKPLSYNNILDMVSGWNLVMEFMPPAETLQKTYACAVIKHNNPCGVAISPKSIADAYHTAFFADSLSAFGGVVAVNQPVTKAMAEEAKDVFLEVIIAPDFEPEALEVLSAKKNLRLVKHALPEEADMDSPPLEFKQVGRGLFLVQQCNPNESVDVDSLLETGQVKPVTSKKPTVEQLEDMVFAWKVVKHVKSNAIVLAKDGQTVGIGGGQTSRIGSLEIALKQACDEARDAVMASDGFLPQVDNIYAAAQARVGAIIQPGGSVKDDEVIGEANRYEIPMVTTGVREFRH